MGSATWRDVLLPRDRVVKAAMIVAVGLGFWQQASGSEVGQSNKVAKQSDRT